MKTRERRMEWVWSALGVLTLVATVAADAGAQAPAVDPAAVQALQRMTDFVDGQQKFSVTTQSVLEELHVSGHRVDRDLAARVILKRPDKFLAARTGGSLDQRFLYDGKTLALYNPANKVYATSPAPETIEKMIDFARETVGILLPAADLLYRGAFPLLTRDLTLAAVVGTTVVDGVTCQHLLFGRRGVDFQVWITEGDKPWPRKYVVTETAAPIPLSITTVLSDWNTAPEVDDDRFTFQPPAGSQSISFMPLEPAGKSGR